MLWFQPPNSLDHLRSKEKCGYACPTVAVVPQIFPICLPKITGMQVVHTGIHNRGWLKGTHLLAFKDWCLLPSDWNMVKKHPCRTCQSLSDLIWTLPINIEAVSTLNSFWTSHHFSATVICRMFLGKDLGSLIAAVCRCDHICFAPWPGHKTWRGWVMSSSKAVKGCACISNQEALCSSLLEIKQIIITSNWMSVGGQPTNGHHPLATDRYW